MNKEVLLNKWGMMITIILFFLFALRTCTPRQSGHPLKERRTEQRVKYTESGVGSKTPPPLSFGF